MSSKEDFVGPINNSFPAQQGDETLRAQQEERGRREGLLKARQKDLELGVFVQYGGVQM